MSETNVTVIPVGTSKQRKFTKSWRCDAGKWGDNCENQCNTTCAENRCDKVTGHCYSCSENYWGNYCDTSCTVVYCIKQADCDRVTGPFCEVCEENKWGSLCEKDCSNNCGGSCQSLEKCKTCREGYWGSSCNVTCQSHCQSCDQDTGVCDICVPGIEKFWGQYCENSCHIPNCAGPLLCTKDDGPTCFRCTTGRWGPGCENNCNERCRGECSMTNGKCLVYAADIQHMHSSKSHAKTSNQPPFATIKILQSGDKVTRKISQITYMYAPSKDTNQQEHWCSL